MFDVSSFLLRWMFLSNLCRDVAEIQTLPACQPYYYPHPQQHYPQIDSTVIPPRSSSVLNPPHSSAQQYPLEQLQQQYAPGQQVEQQQQQQHTHYNHHPIDEEAAWKEQCLRGILSYPPGMQRVMAMDALRLELVQQLAHKLSQDEDIVARYNKVLAANEYQKRRHKLKEADEDSDSDPFLDADLEIVHAFERETDQREDDGVQHQRPSIEETTSEQNADRRVSLVIAQNGATNVIDADQDDSFQVEVAANKKEFLEQQPESPTQHRRVSHSEKDEDTTQHQPEPPSLDDVKEAKRSLLLVRNYLPQLVSAVLKSPPAFDEQLANPIQRLRTLILSRCLNDASEGIELCWLLEAEVGRAWKTLFEHRQQTGRRLIIVLPAEKAAVLAKIGTEKREAFDLLQDAEQATAYGYTSNLLDHHAQQQPYYHDQHHPGTYNLDAYHTRLPSSLSLRRCSHFGDTMHFIDRLTKISSDLRRIPSQHRYEVLHENLHELNRRIRRRMVTRGDVSLDVEDNRSAYDWPHIDDMSVDMIKYSVHLPLIPQIGLWPNGEVKTSQLNLRQEKPPPDRTIPNTEVVRVLNIVVPETKLLSSRERCPFLVHLEVADSGLEGSDARLYAAGATGLGSTVGEALGMRSAGAASAAASSRKVPLMNERHGNEVPSYDIPDELLQPPMTQFLQRQPGHLLSNSRILAGANQKEPAHGDMEGKPFPRGGWQAEGQYYDNHDVLSGGYMVDPFDLVRQQEYEQLHQQLHSQRTMVITPPLPPPSIPKVSLGNDLLDKVFGREWVEKCKEIRDASPYGHVQGWRLASFIMKAGEDIRREAFVMQIISKLHAWFQEEIPEEHRPFMRPYTIMCVGGDAGLLECLSDAKSVDELKKRTDGFTSLRDYFERAYGSPRPKHQVQQPGFYQELGIPPSAPFGLAKVAAAKQKIVPFETAQDNFLRSLVGYSLVCFILQIKDRHNANILIDRVGHIMHIDFGFVLGDTPKMGKVPIFSERAPFKLSGEFWEVLGGWNVNGGGLGVKFCKMFELAFGCASSHADEIAALTEAAMLSLDSNPRAARATANGVRHRLRMRGAPGSRAQKIFIMDLVNAALTSWGTSTYDWLQRNMNGYQ